MKVIFTASHAFVTDAGGDLVVQAIPEGSGPDLVLPRYGVWRRGSGDRFEVVIVTDDRDEAIAKAKE